MAKITIDVDNKDKDVVLTILKNLKSGLIKNIQVDNKNIANSSIKKAPQKPLEDDFFPKPISSSTRYLSKEDFKAKLKKG